MGRGVWFVGLAAIVAGCAPVLSERVRDYNDDGVLLYQRGEFSHARETFQDALKMTPEDANLYFNLGACYVRLGQGEQAEQAFNECLRLASNHVECRHALAMLLYDEGRRPDAVRMVSDWKEHAPTLAAPYVEDGYLWHRFGNLPQAVVVLEHALELDSADSRALVELGNVYEDMKLPDRALVLYESALRVKPGQVDVVERVKKLQEDKVGRPHKD